jgi:hypothetical protein
MKRKRRNGRSSYVYIQAGQSAKADTISGRLRRHTKQNIISTTLAPKELIFSMCLYFFIYIEILKQSEQKKAGRQVEQSQPTPIKKVLEHNATWKQRLNLSQ